MLTGGGDPWQQGPDPWSAAKQVSHSQADSLITKEATRTNMKADLDHSQLKVESA